MLQTSGSIRPRSRRAGRVTQEISSFVGRIDSSLKRLHQRLSLGRPGLPPCPPLPRRSLIAPVRLHHAANGPSESVLTLGSHVHPYLHVESGELERPDRDPGPSPPQDGTTKANDSIKPDVARQAPDRVKRSRRTAGFPHPAGTSGRQHLPGFFAAESR